MSKLSFNSSKAKAVKDALEGMKNETLKALGQEFQGSDSINGGEWVKVKTKFSKEGELTPANPGFGVEP